ncbi:flagellin [Tepidanaerobacter syntrophicus]|uniref:flagellin N-terminal helical domain-containing protein n=1 Tax=Tepidanaerobacter syntrophicus TaxID=224999 RepID=UPI0022EE7138|nr:flagellin [Tepidanaerobacter syntrophicus]GLI18360.1 flagellin [Tepidanaerobacter syntrophicus]
MRINNNIMALNTHRQLSINNSNMQKSLEKLSSGYRINRAGDDAAGLAISEKMRAQIRGLNMASKNAQDGISLIQTAEGGLNETHSILQKMRELAVQSSSDTNIEVDRGEIQKEVDQLAAEITRISNNTEFNTQKLLNGGIKDIKFHIGANEGQNISLGINAMDAYSLGIAADSIVKEATIATGSSIGSVTLADTTGSKVVDGAELSFAYSAEPAKAAVLEGTEVSSIFATSLSTLDKIVLNGQEVALTNVSALDGSTTAFDINTLVSALQSDINAVYNGTAHDGVTFTVGNNGDALTITSSNTGASAQVAITANTASATLGLTATATTDRAVSGTDAAEVITVSNGTDSKDFTITDKTATTFTTGSDADFGGITINLADGKTLENLSDTSDKITIALTENKAQAAVIDEDGKVIEEAVAPKGIDVSTQAAADKAITVINRAIETVSAERSKLGAMQNRLEHTINNLDASAENLQAAESRIRDVDMAKEMMEFTKQNILTQAATAMLAQANAAPQTVLKLLG